jgi:Tfp pilus assembly protein FimT
VRTESVAQASPAAVPKDDDMRWGKDCTCNDNTIINKNDDDNNDGKTAIANNRNWDLERHRLQSPIKTTDRTLDWVSSMSQMVPTDNQNEASE